ncbi:MAG: MlaD family protein [Elusimicrobiales bacterium]
MNDETKVGIFVLAGLALFGTAIFLLGDYSFQTYYPVTVEFQDVAGLPDKSVVKLAGVEVGKIKKIYLKNDLVRVRIAVLEGVKIYKNSKFLVGSTSLIGSKYLQIDQGDASSGVIEAGEMVKGSNILPIDRAMAKAVEDIQGLVSELRGNGSLAKNLNGVLSNLKEVTSNLNEFISATQPHAEKAAERLDGITAKLDSILARTDSLLAKVESGEGVAGALVSDKKMKEDVTAAMDNLKSASASVKDVLGRFNNFRTYWNVQTKYEPLARDSKNDIGVRIYPRDGRYYYLGGANIINLKDRSRGVDYETLNTVDALIGWELNGFDLYAGALRGSGGAGVKYRPFYRAPAWDRLRFLFEASDLSRRRVIKGRSFDKPRYDAGMEFILNKYVSAGLRVNDLAEAKRVNYTAHVMFEDKDIAYLLGFASFGGGGKSK